jgi:hypothetical protein
VKEHKEVFTLIAANCFFAEFNSCQFVKPARDLSVFASKHFSGFLPQRGAEGAEQQKRT